ncbi:MAG: hypothetical protein ACR2IF_09420 [Terriglobales bacterium]
MPASAEPFLNRLEQAKRDFARGAAARVEKLLTSAEKFRFRDAESLIRFHDALLFLRAFPQSSGVARRADRLLSTIGSRVAELEQAGADLDALQDESVSGIAGADIVDTFTYEDATWLAHAYPANVRIYWEGELNTKRLANTLPQIIPLLDEDGFAEPDTPFRTWLDSARGNEHEVQWLLRRFAALPLPERRKAELYESLELPLQWFLRDSPASRTLARLGVPNVVPQTSRVCSSGETIYVHTAPLIARNQVSIARELAAPLALEPLPASESREIIEFARAALAVRYRSLYGMTFGAAPVHRAAIGRGAEIFLWGVPSDRRFPLRAYGGGFTVKNGVPINYLEAISLFDWVEVGFNVFYAFREGETAWIYSQVLRALRQLMGANCISVYPYQIGQHNEEAIASGAFWFYRKLGFRPGRPDLAELCEKEEKKIAARPGYRTPARTLRKLAESHMFFEVEGTPRGDWDRFRTRNIGFAVNRCMAREHNGDAADFRDASAERLARALDTPLFGWLGQRREVFENFAMVLALVPDLKTWAAADRSLLVEIIAAKAAPEEWNYLRLMQQHARLRRAILALGSAAQTVPARHSVAR